MVELARSCLNRPLTPSLSPEYRGEGAGIRILSLTKSIFLVRNPYWPGARGLRNKALDGADVSRGHLEDHEGDDSHDHQPNHDACDER